MSKKVVILEDEIEFRNTLAEALANEGFNPQTISTPKELLTILRNEKVDVIVSDIVLEDANGTNILKLLNLQNIQVPIIFMTGFDNTPELSLAKEDHRVVDTLIKPFKINALINLINNL